MRKRLRLLQNPVGFATALVEKKFAQGISL
jgi:hypothetical protein